VSVAIGLPLTIEAKVLDTSLKHQDRRKRVGLRRMFVRAGGDLVPRVHRATLNGGAVSDR
jgi:hypothetical protein